MSLRKRPKGEEIEELVRGAINKHDIVFSAHREIWDTVVNLRRDVNLLMAHLKLEFKDVPGTPAKRIVGKATKKKAPKGMSGYSVSLEDSIKTAQLVAEARRLQANPFYWSSFWQLRNY